MSKKVLQSIHGVEHADPNILTQKHFYCLYLFRQQSYLGHRDGKNDKFLRLRFPSAGGKFSAAG